MAVSRLRRLVGDRIVTTERGYRLVLHDGDWLDRDEFAQLVDRAAFASAAERPELLRRAVELWCGPAFDGIDDLDMVQPVAAALEEQRRTTIELLAVALLDVGHDELVVQLVEQHRDQLHLRERPVALLMSALARTGRLAEALRAYHRFTLELREVGLAPSVELRAQEQAHLDDAAQDSDRCDEAGGADGGGAIGTMPQPIGTFIGRESELDVGVDALRHARLVTLTGVGGAGKTRTAVEVARKVTDRFPDGQCFIALADLSDPGLVVEEIARAFQLYDPLVVDHSDGLLSRLAVALRARQALIVLDNCEHVRDACAAAVTALLTRCARLRVLTTSREPLHIAGEHIVTIGPLPLPEADDAQSVLTSPAGQLFLARATAADPHFAIDATNSASVAALCRRLDGLPLALELAAARMRVFTPNQIVERLDGTFRALGVARGTAAHHDTLRGSLQWSYDLLDDAHRRLLRNLAVCRGGFRLPDAEALQPDIPKNLVMELVAGLVDKSLVVPGNETLGGRRYHLLEVVRDFALEQLQIHDEVGAAQRRRCDHLIVRCRGLRADDRGTHAIQLMFEELDNVRDAIAWGLASGETQRTLRLIVGYPCWQDHGLLRENVELVSQALDRADRDRLSTAELSVAVEQVAITMTYLGDRAAAEAAAAQLDTLRRATPGHPHTTCMWAFATATVGYYFDGTELGAAHNRMSEAQQCADELGDATGYPGANQLLAAVCYGITPANGIDATVTASHERATSPLLHATIDGLSACWRALRGDGRAADVADQSLAELLALGSGWDGPLLSFLVSLVREQAADHTAAADALATYLQYSRRTGLRLFLADGLRAAARHAAPTSPHTAGRLWATATHLHKQTGLRTVTIHQDRDNALAASARLALGPDEWERSTRQGNSWDLVAAIEVAQQALAHH
jgi:predicted ATPase